MKKIAKHPLVISLIVTTLIYLGVRSFIPELTKNKLSSSLQIVESLPIIEVIDKAIKIKKNTTTISVEDKHFFIPNQRLSPLFQNISIADNIEINSKKKSIYLSIKNNNDENIVINYFSISLYNQKNELIDVIGRYQQCLILNNNTKKVEIPLYDSEDFVVAKASISSVQVAPKDLVEKLEEEDKKLKLSKKILNKIIHENIEFKNKSKNSITIIAKLTNKSSYLVNNISSIFNLYDKNDKLVYSLPSNINGNPILIPGQSINLSSINKLKEISKVSYVVGITEKVSVVDNPLENDFLKYKKQVTISKAKLTSALKPTEEYVSFSVTNQTNQIIKNLYIRASFFDKNNKLLYVDKLLFHRHNPKEKIFYRAVRKNIPKQQNAKYVTLDLTNFMLVNPEEKQKNYIAKEKVEIKDVKLIEEVNKRKKVIVAINNKTDQYQRLAIDIYAIINNEKHWLKSLYPYDILPNYQNRTAFDFTDFQYTNLSFLQSMTFQTNITKSYHSRHSNFKDTRQYINQIQITEQLFLANFYETWQNCIYTMNNRSQENLLVTSEIYYYNKNDKIIRTRRVRYLIKANSRQTLNHIEKIKKNNTIHKLKHQITSITKAKDKDLVTVIKIKSTKIETKKKKEIASVTIVNPSSKKVKGYVSVKFFDKDKKLLNCLFKSVNLEAKEQKVVKISFNRYHENHDIIKNPTVFIETHIL